MDNEEFQDGLFKNMDDNNSNEDESKDQTELVEDGDGGDGDDW